MPFDRKFDPITGDMIRDGRGGFERTTTAETSVLNQLLARRGQFWGDPELGTEGLDAIDPTKPGQDAAQKMQVGLERLVQLGRIADVVVTGSEPAVGRVRVDTRFRDTSTNQLVNTFIEPGK
jgi:hypothetical protein